MQNHNDDTIIKTSNTVLRKIYLSLYLKGLYVRGSWRRNRIATYWPPLLWPSAFLSRSPGLLNRGPGGLGVQPRGVLVFTTAFFLSLTGLVSKLINRGSEGFLCWVLAFSAASCLQLVWSPNWLTGGLRASSARCWLSLPHLVSNWSGLQTLLFLDQMHQLFIQVHFLFWQKINKLPRKNGSM